MRRAERADALGKLLGSFSYRNVLARGFALVRDAEGKPLRAAAEVTPGARLSIQFADGATAATADGGDGAPATAPARTRSGKQRTSGEQGSLF